MGKGIPPGSARWGRRWSSSREWSASSSPSSAVVWTCPWKAPGITLYYAGESESGLPVRVVASFDLPLRPRELPHRIDIGEPETWPWGQIEDSLARRSNHERLRWGR